MSVSALLGYHYYSTQPQKRGEQNISNVPKIMQQSAAFVEKFGNFRFIGLFLNNLTVCLAMTLFGIIPFFFITIPTLIFQYFNQGMLLSLGAHSLGNVYAFLSVISHGVLEIPAHIYSGCLGVYLSVATSRKMFSKYRQRSTPFFELGRRVLYSYSLVIIPLLILASVTEIFVTPKLSR